MPCSFHGTKCDGECKDPNVDNGMMTKSMGSTRMVIFTLCYIWLSIFYK